MPIILQRQGIFKVRKILAVTIFGFSLSVAGSGWQTQAAEQTLSATGTVFADKNGNQQFDAEDAPLAGVRVSNGIDIVKTNAQGKYEIPVTDDTIIFVIKPAGYQVPLSPEKLPQFYYVHKPAGSPESRFPGVAPTGPLPAAIDFPLTVQQEPEQFEAILFGDPQPRNQKEVDWIAHDVIEELVGTKASLGVTLGDIAFDNLDTLEPLNKSIALLGIPWYNVIGNHDINFSAQTRKLANETYERIYGPSYYSFDYGQVHFLVVDNIDWIYDSQRQRGSYRGGLGKEQLQFIENDLQLVPENQLVVLMMHIPLVGVQDRHGLYRLIEKRKYCISISGHTHDHQHIWIDDQDGWQGPAPHHHIVNVTVSGSWWSGALDERGIPHTTMSDGAPNGYSILKFDGTNYQLDFYAAGRRKDHQMQITAPEEISSAAENPGDVFVNFFNGSPRCQVSLKIADSDWKPMIHSREEDPAYRRMYDAEEKLLANNPPEPFRKMPTPKPSSHLWKLSLPPNLSVGTHAIHIRVIDQWQREFTAERVIRVTQ